MFHLRSINRVRADVVLLLLLVLAGCSGGLTRSLAPEPDGSTGHRDGATIHAVAAPETNPSKNLLPTATILDPVPGTLFQPILDSPVTIQWTGGDLDGHVREYRYRLFGIINPDFPHVTHFISFMFIHPDSVLSFYSPDFVGWERLRVRKGSVVASATYSNLTPNNVYAFAVVAVDNRGDHDPDLSPTRNLLDFDLRSSPGLAHSNPGRMEPSRIGQR